MVTVEAFSKGTPVFGSSMGANRELILPELGFVSDNVEVRSDCITVSWYTSLY
jgi:hypothetical protein